MKKQVSLAVSALMSVCNVAFAQAALEPRASLATIETGVLAGTERDGIRTFFGVPYAAPPIGDLRWRAPQSIARWQGTRSAEKFGRACMQPATVGGMPLPPEFADMSEDCLYLNVWAPAASAKKSMPVLVWVHGSGFMFGAGRGFGIDGTSFAKNEVIVVSMNYRLGMFGQFAHPALKDDGTGGNYALLDVLAALEWVKRNIASFGGDPSKVTLAGLSAGGSYSQILMTLPQAKGLFQQVISQSGPLFFGWPTLKEAEQRTTQALASLASSPTAETLRALPAKAIADATLIDDLKGPRPIIDGKFLMNHPAQLLTADRLNVNRMIVGTTNYEGIFRAMSPVPPTLSDQQLMDSLGLPSARIQELYNPGGKRTAKQIGADIEGDRNFVAGARFVARALAKAGASAYEYQFSYVPEVLRPRLEAASHASDQHFVFNQITSAMMWGQRATAADKAMAEAIHGYWIAFIKSGDPNGGERPRWPRYDAANDSLLEFTNAGPLVRNQHWKERLDAVEAVLLREIH